MEDTKENALLLIRAVQNELKLGTKHWDSKGKPLTTLSAIIHALIEGPIEVEPVPSRKHIFKGYAS